MILDAGLAPSSAVRYRGVLDKMLKDARLDGHQVPQVVGDVEGIPCRRVPPRRDPVRPGDPDPGRRLEPS